MPHSLDTRSWPVVRLTASGSLSSPELEQILAQVTQLHARKQPYVNLVDLRALEIDRSLAKPCGEWLRKNAKTIRGSCVAVAFVTESSMFRFLMTALHLVFPVPVPYTIFPSVAQAELWLYDRLEERGLVPRAEDDDWRQLGS